MRAISKLVLTAVLALATPAASVQAKRGDVLDASPTTLDFHTKEVGTENLERVRITNVSNGDGMPLVTSNLWDDFRFGLYPGFTCPALTSGGLLPARTSCDAVVRFSPSEFFAGTEQLGSLTATASDPVSGSSVAQLVIPVVGVGRPSKARTASTDPRTVVRPDVQSDGRRHV
jgi:hypothetical protein